MQVLHVVAGIRQRHVRHDHSERREFSDTPPDAHLEDTMGWYPVSLFTPYVSLCTVDAIEGEMQVFMHHMCLLVRGNVRREHESAVRRTLRRKSTLPIDIIREIITYLYD